MPATLAPDSVFASYRIESLLGEGGMGVVYRASEIASGRPVALKLLLPEASGDGRFQRRFRRESRLMAELDHPHVVAVYASGEVDGTWFLATQLVDGADLEVLICCGGPLHPRHAAQVVAQAASGLDAAHALGLVHRDVKPANVLVEHRDGAPHAYLGDFGLSRHAASQSGLTATGTWVGTLDYAAPEQLQAQPIDHRTDVYALGCVLYEALTGAVPYPAERPLSKLMAHTLEPAPTVSGGAPAAFDEVIARAMAKRPEDRYASAGELGRAALAAARAAGEPPPHALLSRWPAGAGPPVDRNAPTVG